MSDYQGPRHRWHTNDDRDDYDYGYPDAGEVETDPRGFPPIDSTDPRGAAPRWRPTRYQYLAEMPPYPGNERRSGRVIVSVGLGLRVVLQAIRDVLVILACLVIIAQATMWWAHLPW